MYNDQFCGFTGARTIFNVDVTLGYRIEDFSNFGPQEKEILLPMLTQFEVIATVALMTIDNKEANDPLSPGHTGQPDIVVLRQIEPAPLAPDTQLDDTTLGQFHHPPLEHLVEADPYLKRGAATSSAEDWHAPRHELQFGATEGKA